MQARIGTETKVRSLTIIQISKKCFENTHVPQTSTENKIEVFKITNA